MSNAFTERRIGRFFVPGKLLRDFSTAHLQAVFRDVVVLEARASFDTDTIDYLAAHPSFEPVEAGMRAPDYKAFVHDLSAPDGDCFVTWERVK